jgi:hypothetical protein
VCSCQNHSLHPLADTRLEMTINRSYDDGPSDRRPHLTYVECKMEGSVQITLELAKGGCKTDPWYWDGSVLQSQRGGRYESHVHALAVDRSDVKSRRCVVCTREVAKSISWMMADERATIC